MSGPKSKEVDPRGFEGLNELVSDVDALLASDRPSERPTPGSPSERSVPGPEVDEPGVTRNQRAHASTSVNGGIGLGLLVAGVTIVFWMFVALGGGRSDGQSARTSSTPTSAPSTTPSEPQPTPPSAGSQTAPAPEPSPPTATTGAPSRTGRLEEDRPPVGTDLILTMAQIRYCLAESIRIDAAEPVVDRYSASDVDLYNELLSDYNGRCGEYRYWEGDLERARVDIAPYRSRIEAEGRRRFEDGS